MPNKRPSASRRAENARQKAERLRAEQRRRERNRRVMIASSVSTFVVGAVALAVAFWPSGSGSGTAKAASPPASATLAPAGQLTGAPVDGIQSGAMEQLAFHIHAHLQIYVNGQQKQLPYGIGIERPYQMTTDADGNPFAEGGKAIYWLHTHDQSGIIHMEAPIQVQFTLGEFFDMWGQPLTTSQVGPAHGQLTAFVNGKTVSGDPRAIALNAHDVIQLDVGSVVPFQSYTFPAGL
ncbi:hypothetical protein KGQ20_16760 [Catenulispora sp. NF23]|uniref:hypothetical protein n=1 Tax=Catenulispora pinistramenti TaxID=2705254 RepID=UPI001BA5A35A|nr:hypothetical protein [Catenulispora pinistramenti]MBS2534424.1 hypothetical protein [Catenulispora pinistramenti]